MKKETKRKLALHKETLDVLDNRDLAKIAGGELARQFSEISVTSGSSDRVPCSGNCCACA